MYAEIWTTPLLKKTGKKLRTTVRTFGDLISRCGLSRFSTDITVGNWTANCNPLPTTDAQAAISARGNCPTRFPNPNRAAIIVTFQITGAVYERKNFR